MGRLTTGPAGWSGPPRSRVPECGDYHMKIESIRTVALPDPGREIDPAGLPPFTG